MADLRCVEIARNFGLREEKKSGSELLFKCPHGESHNNGDQHPSLSINPQKNVFLCAPCDAGGTAWQLAAWLLGLDPSDKKSITAWLKEKGLLRGGEKSWSNRNLRDIAQKAHGRLNDDHREYLRDHRCLSDEVIDSYKLGTFEGRLTIPIKDEQGLTVDIRRWLPPEKRNDQDPKILHFEKGTGGPRLFPIDQLNNDEFILCEGELDALAAISAGFPAVTITASVQTWPEGFSSEFAGKRVTILSDNDGPGEKGTEKRAEALSRFCSVSVATWPAERPGKWDVSDELKEYGAESLKTILESAKKHQGPLMLLSDVKAKKVGFLIDPQIPLGHLTMMDGDPGIGKSFASLAIATGISLGKGIPGREETEPANVLLLNAEDGLEDTIKPRLERLGADCERISCVTGDLPDFSKDGLDRLRNHLQISRAKLLVIDPLSVYVGSSVDVFRDNQVRPILSRLSGLAEEYHCAVICIRHLTKNTGGKAIYRGQGSIGFIAAARSGLLVGADPDNRSRGVILHVKHNLSVQGNSIGYVIENGTFYWTGDSDLTEDDVLNTDRGGDRLKIEEAEEFLREILSGGPVLAKKIHTAAKREGINTSRTIYKAKRKLGIESKPMTYHGPVYWSLPVLTSSVDPLGQDSKSAPNGLNLHTHYAEGQDRDNYTDKPNNNNNLYSVDPVGQDRGQVRGQDSKGSRQEDPCVDLPERSIGGDEQISHDEEVFTL